VNDVCTVLQQKLKELTVLRHQIECLRLVIPLLQEATDPQMSADPAQPAEPSAQKEWRLP
jgi:hypothetical protein